MLYLRFVMVGMLLLSLVGALNGQQTGPESVRVQAEGLAGFSDSSRARENALQAAQRDAVEKAVGVFIESETTMQNYSLVKDEVLSRSEGFIRTYNILSEGREGDIYRMRIDAVVVKAPFVRDMDEAIENLYRRVGKPRLMVYIHETQHDASGQDISQNSGRGSSTSEKEMRKGLIRKGFTLVNTRRDSQQITGDTALRAARDTSAEILVYGDAKVRDLGHRGSFDTAQADLAVDVVQVDTGQVLASETVFTRGVQINASAARTTALRTAGEEITPMLLEQISYAWIKHKDQGGRIIVVVENIGFGEVLQVQRALRTRVGGVKQLRQRSFAKGTVSFELYSRKSPAEIAERLHDQRFGKSLLEVKNVSTGTLTFRLRKAQNVSR